MKRRLREHARVDLVCKAKKPTGQINASEGSENIPFLQAKFNLLILNVQSPLFQQDAVKSEIAMSVGRAMVRSSLRQDKGCKLVRKSTLWASSQGGDCWIFAMGTAGSHVVEARKNTTQQHPRAKKKSSFVPQHPSITIY